MLENNATFRCWSKQDCWMLEKSLTVDVGEKRIINVVEKETF